MTGYIDSIETFGLVDGPGIRSVVFFSGCQLRCLYCHNPEMWQMDRTKGITSDELLRKLLRNKPYFKRNNGGVTFSGGEPTLQKDFLMDICQKLKNEGVHIALDTCGVGCGDYDKILDLVDLILLDVKHINPSGYEQVTRRKMDEINHFLEALNKSGKPVWIRQVIVPGIMDNTEYIKGLADYLQKIKNIEKVEFLPFHHLGFTKYEKLGIVNPLKETPEMDVTKCEKLYEEFTNYYKGDKDGI